MYLLADGLASGALIARYEMLYRKHPEMACNEASKPENINKNRYRDISPCKFSTKMLPPVVKGWFQMIKPGLSCKTDQTAIILMETL